MKTVGGLRVRNADEFAELDTLGDAGAECPDDPTIEEIESAVPPANGKPYKSAHVSAYDPPKHEETPPAKPSAFPITTLWGLKKKYPALNPPMIDGLVRIGETLNIVAPTKIGKSWMTYGIGLCGATGRSWLQTFVMPKCDVLIIDNELHPSVIVSRISRVCSAMGIDEEQAFNAIDVLSLRGRLLDIYGINERLQEVEPGVYGLVILDAFYRSIPQGMSENDNAAMAAVYNCIDNMASRLNTTFILVDHSTKGNQSEKGVTDVGAGAGSKARAADAHLILREHEDANTFVMEAKVRSFPPVAPLCLKWYFPCWQPDTEGDPTKIKKSNQKKKQGPSAEEREAARQQRRAEQDAEYEAKLLKAVDKAAKSKTPKSITEIRNSLGWKADRMAYIVARLECVIERYPVKVPMPNGGEKDGESLRRVDVRDVRSAGEKHVNGPDIPNVDGCSVPLSSSLEDSGGHDIHVHGATSDSSNNGQTGHQRTNGRLFNQPSAGPHEGRL